MRFLCLLAALSAIALAQTPATWEAAIARQQWNQAEPLLKAALAEAETTPVLRGLATVYRATGRIEAAEPILERLVALDESVSNVEDLARIKAGLGYLDRAEALYRRSLELRLSSGADPLLSIPVRGRLTQIVLAQKKFAEAEQEASTSISLRTRMAGVNSPDLAGDNAILARVFDAQKKWPEAAQAWETVAQIQAAAFGYEDLRLADTLDSLAASRLEMQLTDQAEAALRQALAIRELNLGPSNAEVAATTDQLGKLLYSVKRFKEAEPFFRRSLNIYVVLLGPDSSLLGRNYDNLAVTEAMLETYPESEALYREALRLRDTDDLNSLHHLALVLTAQNKDAEAQPLYNRALAILDARSGEYPEMLNMILSEYSTVLKDLKRPAEAARLDQRLKGGKQVPQGKRPPIAAKQ